MLAIRVIFLKNKEMLIMDDLLHQMMKKELYPGSKLPSENNLAKKYGVPRMTVRNALTNLEERGYIYSLQGKGRYLKEKSIQIQLPLTGDTSFTEKMKHMGYDLRTENVTFKRIPFDEKIYKILHANKSDVVYKIGRLRYINEEPIAIHYSFVKETSFPEIATEGSTILSMFEYYRHKGVNQFASNKTTLSVTFPTLQEQKLLSCKCMVPLIIVESDCVDKETSQTLEYTKILYRSDTFKYDISADK